MAAALLAGHFAVRGFYPRVDESTHLEQIKLFAEGKYRMVEDPREPGYPGIAMLPGYHALCAIVARATGASRLDDVRLFNVALSMLLVLVGFRLAWQVDAEAPICRGLQLAVLPLLTPYYFLVYTDVASLLALAISLSATLGGRPLVSGIALLAATLVRQNAAIFVILLIPLAWKQNKETDRFALRWWPLFIAPITLAVFALIYGRVNLDAPGRHPVVVSSANLALLLLIQAAMFLPVYAASLLDVGRWVIRHPWQTLAAIAVGIASVVFFAAPHRWNQIQDLLRNQATAWLTGTDVGKWTLWIGAPTAAVFAAATPLPTPGARAWFAWSLAALLPVVLVEPRYGIPLLYVFTLFRKRTSDVAEWLLIVYWLILSVVSVGWVVLHPKQFL